TGRYAGYRVRVEPLLDSLAFRKLPSLWLLATVYGEVPFAATFDILVRAMNVEFYSPSADLPITLRPPPGAPSNALIRTDDSDAMPPWHLLQPHMGLFDDPRAKELVVTPRGVRIVYQLSQAVRSTYLVLRQAEFQDISVAPALLRALLDR